jgi:transposase-like protein
MARDWGLFAQPLCWIKHYTRPQEQGVQKDSQSAELRRLRAELKGVKVERDTLKKAAAYFAPGVRLEYAVIKQACA